MKRRCDSPNRKDYEHYGGRGITYDPKWKDLEGFLGDMREGYSEGLTLERIDVNGNYSKDNCKWVAKKDQGKNKRKYSNNVLGVANMNLITNKGVETLQVRIQDPETGKRTSRWYSLRTYTQEGAVKLAEQWLSIKREEYKYARTHGS